MPELSLLFISIQSMTTVHGTEPATLWVFPPSSDNLVQMSPLSLAQRWFSKVTVNSIKLIGKIKHHTFSAVSDQCHQHLVSLLITGP